MIMSDQNISPSPPHSRQYAGMPWHPAITVLNALIIFVLIRVLNDVPQGSNYLDHSTGFLIIEIICTILISFVCLYLTVKWVNIVISHRVAVWIEYACPIVGVMLLVSLIIIVSHCYEESRLTLSVMLPPIFVTVAGEVVIYSWLKASAKEKMLHEMQLNNERLMNRQLKTEMKLMQLQFHPHFLFNMLNTIYFTIDDENIEAKSTVEHLSNLLRGQLYQTDGKVPLAKELSILHSYIFLARKRLDEKIETCITLPATDDGTDRCDRLEIYPHLMLPLVENVFKHACREGRIEISLTIEEGWIKLLTVNSIAEKKFPTDDTEHGLGLSNLAHRLKLIYPPSDYLLETTEKDGIFTAKLNLKLL